MRHARRWRATCAVVGLVMVGSVLADTLPLPGHAVDVGGQAAVQWFGLPAAMRAFVAPGTVVEVAEAVAKQFSGPHQVVHGAQSSRVSGHYAGKPWTVTLQPQAPDQVFGVAASFTLPATTMQADALRAARRARWMPAHADLRLDMTSAGERGGPTVVQQVYASAWPLASATRSVHAALGRHGWQTPAQPALSAHSTWTRAGEQLTLVVVAVNGGSGFLVHIEGGTGALSGHR